MPTLTIIIDLDDHSLSDVATALRWYANTITAVNFDPTLAARILDGPILGHEGQTVGVASTVTDRPATGPATIHIYFNGAARPDGPGYTPASMSATYPSPAEAWAKIRAAYPGSGVPTSLDRFGSYTDADGDTWTVIPAT